MLSGKLLPPGCGRVWAEGRGRDSGSRGAELLCPAPSDESRGSTLLTELLTLR